MHRRTPCVGICSTTYGDLVCRGCKRYAHEIVSWNGYSDAQREQIEARLRTLRLGVLRGLVALAERERAQQMVHAAGRKPEDWGPVDVETQDAWPHDSLLLAAFDLWRRRPQLDAHEIGLSTLIGEADHARVHARFDAECYRRAKAHYEHSFKVAPA